uniref:Uncharacterized protein n=1 Tax=Cyclopterus lumpus TaxID=8103 RepID=A0A8C3ATY4_CYCLU
MAKREERRLRRMKEALDRQKELDPATTDADDGIVVEKQEERPSSWRRGRSRDNEDDDEKTEAYSSRREEEEEEEEKKREDSRPNLLPIKHIRGSVRSPEVSAGDDQDDAARLEAELKLEELKRRRDDAESEEFERMRQKQQEAEVELDELKKKREERKKVLEEEERQKKQEEAERKAREEEEKRKMKEEIERRRAEAAEKRQKVEDTMDEEGRPFKCVSPRGSSLKVGQTFLTSNLFPASMKASHSPVVSKIDNRLEQYTSARENKESRSPRSGAVDLPMVTDSIRNIKSMWEKGNAFGTPGSGGSPFKQSI